MTGNEKKMIEKLGLSEEDFEPKKDAPTIDDLLEAINLLADMVLMESEV